MAFQTVTIVAVILAVGVTFVCASPIPNGQDQTTDGHIHNPVTTASREGRFYGGGLATAQASAMSTAGGTGFGMGWPGLGYGGLGFAGSSAHAAASAGAMGLGYGR